MTDPVPDPGTDLAVYVHWPYCARICPYCDFNVVRDRGRTEQQAGLVEAILADLETQAARIGARQLASIFFGGGTPSLMRAQDVARVIAVVQTRFAADGPVEITLEANPTDAESAHFDALARAGVNRLSLGVQALDDAALRFLGRNHDAAEARRAIGLAVSAFDRLSIDLIYALPDQSPVDWADELRRAVDLGFEHVSPYQLTLEPATAFGRARARGALRSPDEDTSAALYETTQAVLGRAGFEAYEVSNHARDMSARSAHNLHVWRGGDYLGLGPGAHGRLTLDGARTATVAHRDITAYVAGVAGGTAWAEVEGLDATAADEERVMLGLRTVEGVDRAILDRLGRGAAMRDLVADGFLDRRGGRIVATAKGRPILDAVLRALLV